MRSTHSNAWQPTSWQTRKAQQQPVYEDARELEQVVRRAVPPNAPLAPADAMTAANRFVDQAEYISVRKLENERV